MTNITIHISTGSEKIHRRLMTQIDNIKKEMPDGNIEVVVHSKAIVMLLKEDTSVKSQLVDKMTENVTFLACNNSLTGKGKFSGDLVNGAGVVASALVHLISRQEEGWSYLKI